MARIRVLPDPLVNQIAAGEVVERPASVVKELVENALDAEATRIDVAVEAGGVQCITVTDDGFGMAPEDARLAFERHATSKLRTAADLDAVTSLGFRGEALPSIAGVARVRMRTRARGAPLGIELAGEGSGIQTSRELACPEGTRIEVAELFGRIPARRKFLRTAATESRHVLQWLERISLVRPDVHFTLERDGRPVLSLFPTADARERVIAVVPAGIGERLVEVAAERPTARLRGFASPADVRVGSASAIHLYVNARPVRDRLLLHAVREVYRDALPPGRHPVTVLYLEVDPGEVDVNVHPAKWEVRFRDFGSIRGLVRDALGRALRGPELRGPLQGQSRREGGAATWEGNPEPYASGPQSAGRVTEPAPAGDFRLLEPARPAFVGADERPAQFSRLRFVGQMLGTYLVCEGAGAMILLDLHAAHERVLFEQLREALLGGKLERQALLVPIRGEVPRSAADALERSREALDRAGFELEVGEATSRGGVGVTLRSVPTLLAERTLRTPDWTRMLEETARAVADPDPGDSRDGLEAALHYTLATAACHSAVRKGDRLDPREVSALLTALDETVWVPTCPHGRPVACVIEEAELERRFLRR